MRIVRGRAIRGESERRSETFTGEVWADPVLPSTDGVVVNNVFFAPGSRTYWHHHEHGQILQVTAGTGRVCTLGSAPEALLPGDLVWVPPGELHWHGAGPEGYLLHLAISLGATRWGRPVTGEEYEAVHPDTLREEP
jgi:quercetin dioxygenase-like cupin family protein